jgi:ubiquinone/menaquinone biosynthesis C-methylase UbiE
MAIPRISSYIGRERNSTTMDAVDWSAFSAAEVLAFADAVARVARDLARAVPAPRGAPLFGLDMTLADPELLDRFSRHGIFRKYQRAIALGSGLGGVQRWWSVHFGCRVLSVDPHAGVIEAAERLGALTGLAERCTFRVAPLDNLPLRAEQFTHAWSVEDLSAYTDPAAILREALRVLRPAGLLTIALRSAAPDAPAVARWADAATAVGFQSLVVKPLPSPELPYAVYHAEYVLRVAFSAGVGDERRARLLELATRLAAARSDRTARVLLFAERPS